MNFNTRLVESSRNPLARELLRSADLDDPPPQSVTRLALALGLGSSALVTSVAGSAAATAGLVTGTTTVTATSGVSAATSASTTASVVSSGAAATSVGGAAAGVAPVFASSVTALGMLKTMAVVSLTCGTLSFGGTKLAMTIAQQPVAQVASATAAGQPISASRVVVRRTTAGAPTQPYVASPAPPVAEGISDEQVAAGSETQPSSATSVAAGPAANERNVGRQDIKVDDGVNLVEPAANSRQVAASPVDVTSTSLSTTRISAVAAFPSEDASPPVVVASSATAKKAAHPAKSPKATVDTDLEREVALLDRARGALASGKPLVALQALEAYRTQAPSGKLRAESVVLRVSALLALGQQSAAMREAFPLINAAPQSRHAARLRELLGVPTSAP